MTLCLRAASTVSLNYKQLYPTLDTRGLESQCIKDVLSEVKRWESIPNRREPIAVKMVMCMYKKCKSNYLDSLDLVPYEWAVLGIFCFFASPSGHKTPRTRGNP